ncbi:MAG TPA: hypothetical protein DCL15_01700 [Chloroflexi bacterium]|nr:hypothetical protein [Chloroflexota bacterium]HHW84608.1 hypothetical protein [Chloroflexota bacterium]
MVAKLVHFMTGVLRRLFWLGALLTALYFGVMLMVDSIPGVEADPYRFLIGRVVLQKTGAWLETAAVAIWGDQTVLRWRADETMAQLENEIEQLQWLEAQATTRAAALESKLTGLEENLETARSGLAQLAALMENAPTALVIDGVTLRDAQIESYATQKMMEFSVLQEQLALYQQSHRAYLDAALRARSLWLEARQNIKVLEAHLALIDATLTLERTRTPGADVGQNVRRLNERLQAELRRNQRIAEERQRLERNLDLNDAEPVDLTTIFDHSADLARALRNLAASGSRPERRQ